jgi:hypothetical protein
MKAVVLHDFRNPAAIEKVTRPKPGADDELPLAQADDVLEELRHGQICDRAVLTPR